MAKQLKFTSLHISDQKRLARGEQLLFGRTKLRARDCVHHAAWRVLILAGGAPEGEVRAIRELMPKAHITAVDRDDRCLSVAIDAGVDDVVNCDLSELTKNATGRIGPVESLRSKGKFDLVVLDLCAVPNFLSQKLFKAYRRLVTKGGIYVFTFAYGRDVLEAILEVRLCKRIADLTNQGCSERLAKRIAFVTNDAYGVGGSGELASVIAYKGNEMPMCSLLLHAGHSGPLSFVNLEPGDFELAVVYPDAANLYDCPRERIDSLRRRFSALKALHTRTLNCDE